MMNSFFEPCHAPRAPAFWDNEWWCCCPRCLKARTWLSTNLRHLKTCSNVEKQNDLLPTLPTGTPNVDGRMARTGDSQQRGTRTAGRTWNPAEGVLETIIAQDACEQKMEREQSLASLVAAEEVEEIAASNGYPGRTRESVSANAGRAEKEEKSLTQLERAIEAVQKLELTEAELVLGESQNQPPLGEADGSISERRWYQLRVFIESARKAAFYRELFVSGK